MAVTANGTYDENEQKAKTGNVGAVVELARLQEVLLLSASLAHSLEV